jgi:hypothetical protein
MGNKTFPLYLAEFRRLVGDLDLNDAAQRDQVKNGLTDVLKDALILKGRINASSEIWKSRLLEGYWRKHDNDLIATRRNRISILRPRSI